MKTCDHFVGILNDYYHDWRLHESDALEQCRLYRSDLEPLRLLKSAMATKFKYCPKCGVKIDWKNLIKKNDNN